jgi:NADPH:quinone reductase-like Zn-dependent oxidoreductase
MAGEVVAIGGQVKKWSTGDRVCAAFTLESVRSDPDSETMDASLGGSVDGVLTEYRTFPAEVSRLRISFQQS